MRIISLLFTSILFFISTWKRAIFTRFQFTISSISVDDGHLKNTESSLSEEKWYRTTNCLQTNKQTREVKSVFWSTPDRASAKAA